MAMSSVDGSFGVASDGYEVSTVADAERTWKGTAVPSGKSPIVPHVAGWGSGGIAAPPDVYPGDHDTVTGVLRVLVPMGAYTRSW